MASAKPLTESKQEYAAKRLANVLSGPIFKVDHLACAAAANTIKEYRASLERMPWASFPQPSQVTFKLAFVAICHQFNWDFLQERLARHLLSPNQDQMVRRLAELRADELSDWLAGYSKPQRIRASNRAAMPKRSCDCAN